DPVVPAPDAAPTPAATPGVAAPVPAGTVPTVIGPTVAVTAPDIETDLGRLQIGVGAVDRLRLHAARDHTPRREGRRRRRRSKNLSHSLLRLNDVPACTPSTNAVEPDWLVNGQAFASAATRIETILPG